MSRHSRRKNIARRKRNRKGQGPREPNPYARTPKPQPWSGKAASARFKRDRLVRLGKAAIRADRLRAQARRMRDRPKRKGGGTLLFHALTVAALAAHADDLTYNSHRRRRR